MPDERLVLAIGRLERALARIESLPPPRPSAETVSRTDYVALEARHRRLRDNTATALQGIDRLIGGVPAVEPEQAEA